MIKIDIKPLSVNDCWKGERYKTKLYTKYERDSLFLLPAIKDFPNPPYKIEFIFGQSNPAADFDNPVKPLTDILQKKYRFNDKDVYEAIIKKVIVPKGSEYFEFNISTI